jgi:hypothetical protein
MTYYIYSNLIYILHIIPTTAVILYMYIEL